MKGISIATLSVAVLILVGLFAYLSKGSTSQNASSKPTIALVDEDESSSFNNKDYNFGQNFVHLVSGDSQYNWQVVSRSVADRAFADKSVDAVIYIPQSFSHDLLTLQEVKPTQTDVSYKIQTDGSALSKANLDSKIVNTLQGFNTSVVKMYYGSVAGNVADAQNNMNAVVGNQGNLVGELSNNVRPSFDVVNSGYGSVVSTSDFLKGQNSAWINQTNSFTKATQDNLNSTSHSLSGTLPGVNGLFNDLTLMGQTNVANGNVSMLEQRNNDFTTFQNYLTPLNNGLNGFDGDYANFQNSLSDYKKAIYGDGGANPGLVGDLNTQLDQLNNTSTGAIPSLQDLETSLLQEYGNITPTTPIDQSNYNSYPNYTEDDAANALAAKLQHSFEQHSQTVATYEQRITDEIKNIATDPSQYQSLFDIIDRNTSGAASSNYGPKLALIRAYAGTNNISSPSLNVVSSITTAKSFNVTIPAGTSYTFTPSISNPASITYNGPYTSTGGSTVTVNGNRVTVDNTQSGATSISFKANYIINLDALPQGTNTVSFNGNGASLSSDVYINALSTENEKAAIGGTGFKDITDYLGEIDAIVNELYFLYGSPTENYTTFQDQMSSTGNFTLNSQQSMYARYDSIDPSTILEHLKVYDALGNWTWNQDVESYYTTGQDEIMKVVTALTPLYDNQSRLQKDLTSIDSGDLSPNLAFDADMKNLDQWRTDTTNYINDSTNQWNSNKVNVNLTTKEWKDKDGDIHNIYTDQTGGDSLYQTISSLMKSTSESATATAKAAQMIKDNSNQFEQMIQTVQTTKSDAQKVLDTTDASIKNGQAGLNASQNYNAKFGQVLSNTRNPEANQNQLFNFFAQPLGFKNLSGTSATISNSFDWRWLIMLVSGIILGILGNTLIHQRSQNMEG